MINPTPNVQWVSSTPADVAVTVALALVLILIVAILLYTFVRQRRRKTARASSLPVFMIPSTDSSLRKYGGFPTKGILLPPSPYLAPSRERSIRFKGRSGSPSFGASILEPIPEEECLLSTPPNAILRGDGVGILAPMQPSGWTRPTCTDTPQLGTSRTPDYLRTHIQLPSQTCSASTSSRKKRLSRLQSLLEVPCSSKLAAIGASVSMPSIFSLPSWLAERTFSSRESSKNNAASQRECSIISSSHLRTRSADGVLMSDHESKTSLISAMSDSSIGELFNYEKRRHSISKAHESVGTLMLSRLSLSGSSISSSSIDSCDFVAHALGSPPRPILSGKSLIRPESGISETQSDLDESEIIITMENWTTIKRVPSLLRNRKIVPDKESASLLGASLMSFVKDPTGVEPQVSGKLLDGKQESVIPSLTTISSLYGGIQSSHSLV